MRPTADTPPSLEERLRAAFETPARRELLASDLDPDEMAWSLPAAVLIAVTDRPRPGVILTQRNAGMRNHAGQVAFPGGKVDPGEDVVAAALREAHEEIALPRDKAIVIDSLDSYVTGSGFEVTPVVAVVAPDLPLTANPDEVDHWFEAPLDALVDPANRREGRANWNGRTRRFWRIDYEGYDIWGATAAMLVNLGIRLHK